MVPLGPNALAKHTKNIVWPACLNGKFTIVKQLYKQDDFHPLKTSELTGHANTETIAKYSLRRDNEGCQTSLLGLPLVLLYSTRTDFGSTLCLRETTMSAAGLQQSTHWTITCDYSESSLDLLTVYWSIVYNNFPANNISMDLLMVQRQFSVSFSVDFLNRLNN